MLIPKGRTEFKAKKCTAGGRNCGGHLRVSVTVVKSDSCPAP